MESLNELLNKVLETSNENYTKGKENIKKCFNLFSVSSEKDDIALTIFTYFFPFNSNLEKNAEEFWFIKYRRTEIYDEYDFAIDLLKNYAQYLSDRKSKSFDLKITEITKQFGNYKFFSKYLSIVQGNVDILMATVAYFTKENFYFQQTFGLNVLPQDIQTNKFIDELKKKIENQKISHLTKKLYQLEELFMKTNSLKDSNPKNGRKAPKY